LLNWSWIFNPEYRAADFEDFMSDHFEKLESYVNSLAENIKQLFEQLAGTRVLSVKIKVEERIRANYALAVLVGYEHQQDHVKGNVILGFEDQRMAEIVAESIGANLENPPEESPDSGEASDVLSKFMNNIVDLTTSKWETQGFSVNFGTPQTMRNALIQNISGLASRAFLVVFNLGVDHIIFRVTFNEAVRENSTITERKILVVDDSKLIRNIMTEVLEKVGFTVAQAQNGVEAIEQYEKFKPDVTVMDLNMPEMGGMDAITAIREKDKLAKFIILTSSARRDEVITAKGLGVSSYLLKPFQPKQLLDTLKKVLNQETT
jgi:two-component system chemotaxis response regulator CheY